MGFTEIFVSTHEEALKRAGALEGGAPPPPGAVRIPDITDFEVERLGDLAGTAVHAPGADYELAMVDVASDSLLGVPPAMVRALAELLSYETEGRRRRPGRRRRKLGRRGGHALRCRSRPRATSGSSPNWPPAVDPATRSGLYVWTS